MIRLFLKEEEDSLRYSTNSPFSNPEHSFRKELDTRRISSEEESEDSDSNELKNSEEVEEKTESETEG